MKTLVLALVLSATSLMAAAQLPQGSTFIGGSIGYNSTENSNGVYDQKSSNLTIMPRVGWAKRTNRMEGIWAGYSLNTMQYPPQEAAKLHEVSLGYFQQRYLSLNNVFSLFGEGNIGGGYGWRKGDDYKSLSLQAGVGGGIAYLASSRFLFTLSAPNALAFSLNYSKTSVQQVNGTPATQTSFGANIYSAISLQNMQAGVMVRL